MKQIIVTAELAAKGLRVVRGRDWDPAYGDQDCRDRAGREMLVPVEKRIGTIESDPTASGWVSVRWDSGNSTTYRVGAGGRYDLYVHTPGGEESKVPTGAVTKGNVYLGMRVCRGKDWSYGDQDCYNKNTSKVPGVLPGGPGTIKEIKSDYVWVEWDTGHENSYYIGQHDSYDLNVYYPRGGEIQRKWVPSDAVTKENAYVGMKVQRGRDWIYTTQDVYEGNEGEIIEVEGAFGDLWVKVRWKGGTNYGYRIGYEDKYDLVMYDYRRDTKYCAAKPTVKEARESLEELGKSLKPNTNKNGTNTEPIKVRRSISIIGSPKRRASTPVRCAGSIPRS